MYKIHLLCSCKKKKKTTHIIDPCNARFLIKFKNMILDSITTIVNQSLITGTFLEDWKIASMSLLTKNQNLNTELTNYISISNLYFLCKIIEKAAQTQLHFDNQSLLPKYQSAYKNVSLVVTLKYVYQHPKKYEKSKMHMSSLPGHHCCF